jgi:3-oxoacyl-[acyl-carrier-protein] synthase II
MEDNRVVITGAGIVSALGHERKKVFQALIARQTGIQPITGFDASGFECSFAAQVTGLNPRDLGIHPRDSRIMDTHAYMLIKCARDAFLQAGLENASFLREDIGFFAGMGMVDYRIEDLLPSLLRSLDSKGSLDYDAFYTDGYRQIYPLWPLSMLNNISFCQAGINLDMRGENTVFSPHADSGVQAVTEGMHTILEGKTQVVLAGGVSEKVSPFSLARSLLSGTLNTSDKQANMSCRPFAADRKGSVPGEGCSVLALERYKSAADRGIPCLALIKGYGSAYESDDNLPGPSAWALSASMEMALENAELFPSDIDVIIAHGDGTIHGDENEIMAIHKVFTDCIEKVHVFSSKGALGNLLAASPVVDIVLAISMFETGIIPPTLTSSPDSRILFKLVSQPLKKDSQKILINCLSCEGHAASIIIESVK